MLRILAALSLPPLLAGCVVHAAYDVATAPVRVGAKVVDWTTTSQSEADRNAGRKIRKDRERQEKEARKAAKEDAKAQRERRGESY